MRTTIPRLWYVWIVAGGLAISSCVKDKNFLEPYRFIAYVDPVNTVQGYNALSSDMLVLRDRIIPGADMAFVAKIFAANDKEVQLTAVIDTSLIPVYDRITQAAVPSPALPAGAFSFTRSAVTIPAGAVSSTDSIKLVLADASRLNLAGLTTTYTVPVRLNTIPGGSLPTEDTLRQTIFFRVSFTRVFSSIPGQGDSVQYIQFIKQSDGTLLQDATGFDASLNITAPVSLKVSIAPQPSLVPGFNAANHTFYSLWPAVFFNTAKSTVTIPAGSTGPGADSFRITFPGMPLPGAYLLPLQIKDDEAVMPGANRTVYLAAELVPEIIYARTNWRIVAVTADNDQTVNNVLDGRYNTYWYSSLPDGLAVPPQGFTVDMGQVNLVKGIMLRYNPAAEGQQPAEAKVYTSMDNQTWDAGQTIAIPRAVMPEKNLMIYLPEAVSGRYIKLVVTAVQGASPSGVTVTEFGAF